MRIIINQPRASYFIGGAEMISFEHAINFFEQGYETYYFTISPRSIGLEYSPQFKNFYNNYSDKIKIIEIEQDKKIKYIYDIQPGEDRCRWNIESIFYNQLLYEYILRQNINYDIIFSYYNLDAVFFPRNLIKKNILYLCGVPKQQNDFQGSFLSKYDIVIAISEEVKQSWAKYYHRDMRVVSTGVNFSRFSLKKIEKNNQKNITLLYIGRLISRKNVDKIIYAYDILRKEYDLRLIIVGDGPDRTHLESISSHSEFVGVVSDTETYYHKADIFISPSEYGEGLQGSVLEAMSCGLTVVATNTQVNRELLANGRGIVVIPTVESITEGIKKAITCDRIKNSKKIRDFILKNYSSEKKVKEILKIINDEF